MAIYQYAFPAIINSNYSPALPQPQNYPNFPSVTPYQTTPTSWNPNSNILDTMAQALAQSLKNSVTSYSLGVNDFYTAGLYNRVQQNDHMKDNDVAIPGGHENDLAGVLSSYNEILKLAMTPETQDYSKLDSYTKNNTFFLGPISNKSINFGDGDNIIMSSPLMLNFVNTIQQFYLANGITYTQDRLKIDTQVFYPSAQGKFQSNDFTVGNGNNVIYYDSSVKSITVKGNGNNIFAPSKGSFNFAYNSFQVDGATSPAIGNTNQFFQVNAGSNTSLTPIQQSQLLSGAPAPFNIFNDIYLTGNIYNLVSADYADAKYGSPGYLTNVDQKAQATYLGTTATDRNALLNADGTVNQISVGNIGGETLTGGDGNDIFYGVDPSFLGSIGSPGSTATVFSIPGDKTAQGRFNEQNFHTIIMNGGGGSDIYYLGNPTKIAPNGNQFKGAYTYIVSSSHKTQTTAADKAKLNYDSTELGVNIINVNLQASQNSYTNSASSYTSNEGPGTSTLDKVKLGVAAASSILGMREDGGSLTFLKYGKYFPLLGTAATAASVALDVIPAAIKFLNPPTPPVVVTSTEISQPLGDWKNAVNVNDWNPNLTLQIQVDPSSNSFADTRWDSFQFSISSAENSTSGEIGSDVVFKSNTNGVVQKLFHIDSLGADNSFGYYGWSFIENKPIKITQNNLDFFGQLPVGIDGISPITKYTAKNGLKFSDNSSSSSSDVLYKNGTYQFYFNDSGSTIANAKKSVDTIEIKFDSTTLGWYWAPVFKSLQDIGNATTIDYAQITKNLTIDEDNSKLFYSDGEGVWSYYTFTDFSTKTDALIRALEAKTYYATTVAGETKITTNQQNANTLVDGLKALKKYMPDLTSLKQDNNDLSLLNLNQITAVKESNLGNKAGVEIYYTKYKLDSAVSTNKDIYKLFIYDDASKIPIAGSSPEKLSISQVHLFEDQSFIDINQNGIIGAPVVSYLSVASGKLFVDEIYKALLNRNADLSGESFWVNNLNNGNTTRSQIIENFLNSSEFASQFTTNQEFITSLYNDLLSRSPDPSGIAYWSEQLDNGHNKIDIVGNFIRSSEFASIALPVG